MPETKSKPNLRFTADVKDIDSGTWFLRAKFRTIDKGWGACLIERGRLGKWNEIGRELSKGAVLPTETNALVEEVMTAVNLFEAGSRPQKLATRKTGFVDGDFVLPDKTIGPRANSLSFIQGDQTPGEMSEKAGTIASWLEGLREPCSNSSYLTFYVAAAFAGPLLGLFPQEEGAIFHAVGQSSSGKSLATYAAASVRGRANLESLASFALTERAIEEYCAASNHLAMVIDEYERSPGTTDKQKRKNARKLAFTVASGKGEMRSKKATKDLNLKNLNWKTIGLSSGETSLRTGTDHQLAGEQVRLIEISVPGITKNNGIFDRIKSKSTDKDHDITALLFSQIANTIEYNYGVAIRFYLESIVSNMEKFRKQAARIMDKFVDSADFVETSWDRRFARKFGIVLAGALLAARCGSATLDRGSCPRVHY